MMNRGKTKRVKEKVRSGQIVLLIATTVAAIIFLIPIFFALISAFKTNGEIIANPIALPEQFSFDNFRQLFEKADILGALKNTLILTIVSELLIVLIVPMSAYGIARTTNKWLKRCYTYFLAGMMIPFHLYMFSLFREMQAFGIYKTLIGPIVCYISGSVSFGTLLYCSFLNGIPLEIEEAAAIERMMATIKWNLTLSMVLNFLAIALAITGILNPVIGALVHNAGSVFVIINSSLLLG